MYQRGDVVWLRAFENEPRQRGTVMGPETKGVYPVLVDGPVGTMVAGGKTFEAADDHLRQVPVEQIDGYALVATDFRRAIWAQDASNLSGVLYDYAKSMHKIRAEGIGSEEAARHPISILMLDKLVSLAGGTVKWLEDDDTYGKALQACRAARDASTETAGQLN